MLFVLDGVLLRLHGNVLFGSRSDVRRPGLPRDLPLRPQNLYLCQDRLKFPFLISVSVPFKVTKGEISPPLVQYPSKMQLIESSFFDEKSVFNALFRLNVYFFFAFCELVSKRDFVGLQKKKRYLK